MLSDMAKKIPHVGEVLTVMVTSLPDAAPSAKAPSHNNIPDSTCRRLWYVVIPTRDGAPLRVEKTVRRACHVMLRQSDGQCESHCAARASGPYNVKLKNDAVV
jgi:hypothetical protein